MVLWFSDVWGAICVPISGLLRLKLGQYPKSVIAGLIHVQSHALGRAHRTALRLDCGLQRAQVSQAAGLEGLELLLWHLDVLPFGAR